MKMPACVLVAALFLLAPRHGDAPSPPYGAGEADVPGAMRALRFLAGQRAYPGRDLPRSGYTAAFDRAKALGTATAARKDGGVWTTMGPHNIGGRTLALAFNPQDPATLWAGAASGGLWRSRTGGVGADAWEYVPTGHPVLGVGAIAIAPDDSNVMYVGTGEVYSYADTEGGLTDRLTRGSFGIGILKSIDAGRTWRRSLDWSYEQQRGVQVVRIDPTNPNVVWAGTTHGTYKSINGGLTWNRVDATVMATDLVIHPTRPNTVVMAAGNLGSPGTRLYRTTDGGITWASVLPTTVVAAYKGKAMLSLCAAQPDIIYASIGNGGIAANATWLLRSTDAGATWTVMSNTDYARYQGWFAHDVAVHPEDPTVVIAAGVDIWRSTNSGVTLVKKSDWADWDFGRTPPGGPEGPPWYSHADHHDIVFHPTDPDIVYFANDGGVFRSLDGGLTFAGCNGGYQTQQFYAGVSVSPHDPQLVIGGMQDNATAIFDGSVAWTRVIGGDGAWTGIDAADDLVRYGSAQYLVLFRSRDGGATWFEITPPNQGQTSFIAPFALGGPATPDVIYAGRTFVFKSVDKGTTWQTTNGGMFLEFNPILALAVSQTDSDVAYATTAPLHAPASVFRTLDGGTSWQEVTGALPDRYPVGLAIDPSDDRTVYVTFSGFGTEHVYRSNDAGGNWTVIGSGLPDVPTCAVAIDPLDPDIVYVGTDLGVFATVSGGSHWFAFNDGLPEAVMAMDLEVAAADRRLVLATHGNGMFSRPLLEPVTGIEDGVVRAAQPVLHGNAPNPFNPATEITFAVPTEGRVRLEVFDVRGRRLRTLMDGFMAAGSHALTWDGRDDGGRGVPSGTYFCRLQSDGWHGTIKMQLVR